MLSLKIPYLLGTMTLATLSSRGRTTKEPLIVPVVIFGNVFASGFGWDLLVVSVLTLAKIAASSAGLNPASS